MNRMDRLFALVLQLQAHGHRRAQDLAEVYEVSVRTIYRDVQALCEAGVPVVALPGQGYALTEGYFLPPLMFTGLEAGTLSLGADYIARTLDAPFRAAAESAQAKLSNALAGESRRELEQVQESIKFVQSSEQPTHKYLRLLREAIVGRRVLGMTYHTYGRPAPEDRVVEPYGLLHFGNAWQLLAYCRQRQAPRVFRLDRIDDVRLLHEQFERNAAVHSVNPHAHSDVKVAVTVRARSSTVRWLLEERPFGLVEKEYGPEFTVLRFLVRDPDRLVRLLLGYGDAVEVVSPASLREHMVRIGQAVADTHARPLPVEVLSASIGL